MTGSAASGPRFRMRDIDNRDDAGAPWEMESTSLADFIGYVDGALRSDVTARDQATVDNAIKALRNEDLESAQRLLNRIGVYVSSYGGAP